MLTHSRKSPQVPFQEITEFLQQLVSIPSVESEQAIATCVAEKLIALGFEPHLIEDSEHPFICHHQAATAYRILKPLIQQKKTC
jgi:acetylornithine deacetylase/succinyl-diaminopimelate desuccinylase-like protein